MKRELLHGLLMEVIHTGSARIMSRQLLWMLGRTNDRPEAWALLLDEWEELGQNRAHLYAVYQVNHGNITLVFCPDHPVPQAVTKWAGETS